MFTKSSEIMDGAAMELAFNDPMYREYQELREILDSYIDEEIPEDETDAGRWLLKRTPVDFYNECTDIEFEELVKLPKKTCEWLNEHLASQLMGDETVDHIVGNFELTTMQMLVYTLMYLSTGVSYRELQYMCYVNRSTLMRIITPIRKIIANMSAERISWSCHMKKTLPKRRWTSG